MQNNQAVNYDGYQRMKVEIDSDGIALLTLNNPAKLNAVDELAHHEAANIWLDLNRDSRVRCIVITGEGKAFSAGGDMDMIDKGLHDNDYLLRMYEEARGIVHNMVKQRGGKAAHHHRLSVRLTQLTPPPPLCLPYLVLNHR